jgi:hypothetical protein
MDLAPRAGSGHPGIPAFKKDGLLVITLDESDGHTVGPTGMLPGGTAGGRIGALVLSPFTRADTTSNEPYKQYSLLAMIEDVFNTRPQPRTGYYVAKKRMRPPTRQGFLFRINSSLLHLPGACLVRIRCGA